MTLPIFTAIAFMKCPKCITVELVDGVLGGNLAVKDCAKCEGTWIPAQTYQQWQTQNLSSNSPELLNPHPSGKRFNPSPLDAKAALCPQCRRYLSRAKVKIETPFFVERCQQCEGIWCDRGEWDILTELGLSANIQQLFDQSWQTQVQQQKSLSNERQGLIDKMGPQLAEEIFQMVENLSNHPHANFALAYLTRKVVYPQEK
ncbi:MAG: zf-TFIIB domain-containing protein [Cyanobacteriota bacterium]|nr:zf-TFIIB domain-containing protein [Cyanobacteriota bacterium]